MSAKKIQPLGNRIVVKRKESMTSKGGILLPEGAKEKPKQGTVMAAGAGKVDEKGKLQKLEVKVGDEVLFSSYSGTEYKSGEEEFLVLSEEDVLAIVK